MKNILPDYNYQMTLCGSGFQTCPEFSWAASSCDDWKDGWDETIGGIFPYMTKEVFINNIIEGCQDYFDE